MWRPDNAVKMNLQLASFVLLVGLIAVRGKIIKKNSQRKKVSVLFIVVGILLGTILRMFFFLFSKCTVVNEQHT